MSELDPGNLKAFQIESTFLSWLDGWHANHDYELDYTQLFSTLQIQPRRARTSFYDAEYQRVHLQEDQHFNRLRHEALHELAHLLFNEAEGGMFRAALCRQVTNPNFQNEIEESIVRKAGIRLALPRHHATNCIAETDSIAAASVKLARTCHTSFGLATRYVVQMHDRNIRGMIIDSTGKAVDGFGFGSSWAQKYAPKPGHLIAEHHELRNLDTYDATVRMRCAIPFKISTRREMSDAEAYHDSRRRQTIVLFYKFKQIRGNGPTLFDLPSIT